MESIYDIIEHITPPDENARAAAKRQWDSLAKPLGSLGLFEDEVTELCDGDDSIAAKYRRVFDYAKLKRKSWAVREAAVDSKRGSILFNLLKQEENGGYTSASAPNKGSTLRLIWDSAGGAEAFK